MSCKGFASHHIYLYFNVKRLVDVGGWYSVNASIESCTCVGLCGGENMLHACCVCVLVGAFSLHFDKVGAKLPTKVPPT